MKLPFGKKKTDAEPENPEKKAVKKAKKASSKLPGSGTFIAGCFAAVVLIVYGCAGALFVLQQQKDDAAAINQLKTGTEALAARLSDRMQNLRTALESLTHTPSLAQTLLSGDTTAIADKEQSLQGQLPNAWHVRLFLTGQSEPDTQHEPQMSYASLDILRQAEKSGKTTKIEVHQYGSKNQHIALAAPIFSPSNSEEVIGIIHAAFKLDTIHSTVNAVSDYGGQVEVRQIIQGKTLTLAKTSASTNVAAAGIPIAGTIWEAVYFKPSTAIDQASLINYGGIPTAGLLIIGLIMFLQAKRLKQALKSDQGAIIKMAETAFKGGSVISPDAKTADCENTMKLIAQLSTYASRKHRTTALSGASASGMEAKSDTDQPGPSSPDDMIVDTNATLHDADGAAAPVAQSSTSVTLPDSIFLAYDIRGIVGDTLTRDMIYELGRAIGSEAYDQGQQTVIMARDGRLSSEGLSAALCQGLQESGRDVLDIGMVPVPILYFATHFLGSNSGVMLTASHNPADYNGLKIVINGEALSGQAIQRLRQRVETGDLLQGEGTKQKQNIITDYINRITKDVQPARPLKVVVDCGNGVPGVAAPLLLKELGCEVMELFCDVDGNFPNHHPDPGKPENLEDLIHEVKKQKADLGVAFDGDGDRLGVVDSTGKIIWPDRLLMLFATDVLSRQPGGDIIYDVKSTRSLASHILSHGGRPLMWKTGHSLMKAKLKETGALLAGEMSGHIFFKERWYGFDDALYACARLLEILSLDPRTTAEVFAELPEHISTPELFMDMPEGNHHELVQNIINLASFEKSAKLITLDGLRAEFENGWGLVRPSNTIPAVTFRFEAANQIWLNEIQEEFRQLLKKIDPNLKVPF